MSTAPVIDADAAVIVALGSNLPGDHDSVESLLEAALEALEQLGIEVIASSSLWRSAAWPDPSDPPFLNMVAVVRSDLHPIGLLDMLHSVELQFGRSRHLPNGPRTLDLDLIAYGRELIDEGGFHVPHPRAHERRFVMGPLAEILPGWRHPKLRETVENLATAAKIGMDAAPIG